MLVALETRFSFCFFEFTFGTYVPVLARQGLKLTDALIASLGTFQGITRIIVRLFLGKLIRKVKAKRLLIVTLCMCGAVGLLLRFANSFYYLALLACLFGVSHGVNSPLSTLLVADSSTRSERGFANSILYSAMTAGRFTPILTAPIADIWGVSFVFPIASILPITAVLVVAKFMEPLSTEQEEKRKPVESMLTGT